MSFKSGRKSRYEYSCRNRHGKLINLTICCLKEHIHMYLLSSL